MKKILFLSLILCLFLLSGCQTQTYSPELPSDTSPKMIHIYDDISISSISLSTDKELYHSGEKIHLNCDFLSDQPIENADLKFYGIYSTKYRLNKKMIINISEGENSFSLEYHAPSCYGCTGIKPGTYKVNADIIYNSKTIANSSKNIEIRQ